MYGVTVTILTVCDVVIMVPVVVPHVVGCSCHSIYGVAVMITMPYGAARVW
jgi:hypothetical protein